MDSLAPMTADNGDGFGRIPVVLPVALLDAVVVVDHCGHVGSRLMPSSSTVYSPHHHRGDSVFSPCVRIEARLKDIQLSSMDPRLMLAISGRNRNQPKSLQTLRASGWGVVVDSKFTSSHSVLEASLASFRQAFARSASMRQLGLQWQDFAFLLLLVSFCFYGAVTKDGSFERFAACLTIWNGCMSSIDIDISRSDRAVAGQQK